MVQFKKWQLYLVILFSFFAIIFSLPNFLSKEILEKTPSFIPSEKVVLGLDLQGGSYLLIEVDTQSVIKENLETFSDNFRTSLRKNKISYKIELFAPPEINQSSMSVSNFLNSVIDIRDNSFVSNLVKGKDIVFHLAALISIPFSYKSVDSFVQTNISGSINVFESSKIHNVERVIHTSTSEVYGTAITTPISEDHPYQGQSPYSASKIGADMMADSYARCFSLPVVILRPFNTYGPRQSERAVISSA